MVCLWDRIVFPLLLFAGFGLCQQEPVQIDPDSIERCAVQDKCDDGECINLGENSTARGAGFYQYTIDEQGQYSNETWGSQFYVCACNWKGTTYSEPITVEADSVCGIHYFKMPLPEFSSELCPSDKDDMNCLDYCANVTFATWKEANTFPEGTGGVGAVSATADNPDGCECNWGEVNILGCAFTDKIVASSGPTQAVITSGLLLALAAFAVVIGV